MNACVWVCRACTVVVTAIQDMRRGFHALTALTFARWGRSTYLADAAERQRTVVQEAELAVMQAANELARQGYIGPDRLHAIVDPELHELSVDELVLPPPPDSRWFL